MLSYGIQTAINLIGTETAPVSLTTSYTGNSGIIKTPGVATVTLYVQYTAQTANNSIQIKVEGSPDAPVIGQTPTVYQDVVQSAVNGTVTLTQYEYTFTNTGTTAQRIRIPFPTQDFQLKVSLKETVASGSAGTASVRVLNGPNN